MHPGGNSTPGRFCRVHHDIGDHTVHGWIWKDSGDSAPEYCVVYGRNENGEEGFYRYDQKEMTLQRYFQDPDAADARSKYLKVAEDYNSLLKDYEIRGMFVIGLFALSILLVIIIIVLLLRKPKDRRIRAAADMMTITVTTRADGKTESPSRKRRRRPESPRKRQREELRPDRLPRGRAFR